MKKLWFLSFALSLLLMTGCAMNEFDGVTENAFDAGNGEISFSMSTPNITRATGAGAADTLEKQFTVYGVKVVSDEKKDVFPYYSVNWEGNEGQTLSNTKGWEYVGYYTKPIDNPADSVKQSIKYWDFSASKYVFVAWKIKKGSKAIIEKADTTELKFQIPTADDAGKIYVSNKETVKNANFGNNAVEMTFRNLAAKVRLGIYETVPGYAVKDVKFYESSDGYGTGSVTTSNTPTIYVSKYSKTQMTKAGNVTVTFDSIGGPVTSMTKGDSTKILNSWSSLSYTNDYEYKETGDVLGRQSNMATMTATLNNADKGYVFVFPQDTMRFHLRVDYTLVSIDGLGETITVKGAFATIPAQYGKWEANHAYTYLFKISDRTNGYTGDSIPDPENPDPNPALYPISFDACVVDGETGNDNQETVTTLSQPSFTTYQSGVNVTTNNEYVEDDTITVRIYDPSKDNGTVIGDVDLATAKTGGNLKLYTAISVNGAPLTEANVAEYDETGILLTDVTKTLKVNGKEAKFAPAEGKTYVVEYTKGSNKYYKVIQIAGTREYKFNLYAYSQFDANDTTALKGDSINEGESFYVWVTEKIATQPADSCSVIGANSGANKLFDDDTYKYYNITDTADVYKFTAKAGVDVSNVHKITLKLGGTNEASRSITICAYSFSANKLLTNLVSGTDTAYSKNNKVFALKLDKDTLVGETSIKVMQDGNVVSDGSFEVKQSINHSTDKMYNIKLSNKAYGDYTIQYLKNSVVLAELSALVDTFSITAKDTAIINLGGCKADSTITLVLKLGGSAAKDSVKNEATDYADLAGQNSTTNKAETGSNGEIVLTGKKAGTAKISAPDGRYINIEVKNFAVKFYSDANCSNEVESFNSNTTYYVKFTDGTDAKNVDLETTGITLTTVGVGIYSFEGTTQNVTIKYTYKGVTFTLFEKSNSPI